MVSPVRSLAFVFAFLISLALSGVARAQEALRIGYSDWPGWHLWDVAKEKGFFDKAGVKVELVWMDYMASMEAFSAGKLDGVAMTNGDAMVTGAGGRKGTNILLNDFSNGNDMIVVAPGRGIETVKDLKGKKIGLELNIVDHLLLLKALEMNGMSESDVTLVNVSTPETPQTLASGDVDAIGSYYPFSGQALTQVPGSKTIFTSKDAPGLIFDCLYVGRESLAARRGDWKKVAEAWYMAVDYLKDPATRDDAIKIMAGRCGVAPAEYAPFLDGTYHLSLDEAAKAWQKSEALTSIYGSTKVADAFNVKHKVYESPQDIDSYLDPSITMELAKAKGITVAADTK
ncbi:MAG TPA: ABC transporter substrate-binding protein [Tepidisphaeraceae bacterium]|jgi:NitT/TauT family transport system substrate-binding protein|nr:ABC transporter substrate-binding protein [Tepidisphaeraceae bacterium]